MNLQQRAEFERQLAEYVRRRTSGEYIHHHHNEHNARCDLIKWVEQNIEAPAQPIDDTSGGN